MSCDKHFITLTGACDFLALEQFYSIFEPETLLTSTGEPATCFPAFGMGKDTCKSSIFWLKNHLRGLTYFKFTYYHPVNFEHFLTKIENILEPKCNQIFIIQPLEKLYTRGQADWMIVDWTTANLLHPFIRGSSSELTTLDKTWRKTLKSKSMANQM